MYLSLALRCFIVWIGVVSVSSGQPIPVISRVSGCVDVGDTTTECVKPFVLTLYGIGFMIGMETDPYAYRSNMLVGMIDKTITTEYNDCHIDYLNANNTDTQVVFQVDDAAYGWYNTDQVLNITFINLQTKTRSVPFPGVTFKPLPEPKLQAISGCRSSSSDGQTVYGCVPHADSITLIGTGFSSLNHSYIQLKLGNAQWTELLDERKNAADVPSFSDTIIQLSLESIYHSIVGVDSYGGAPLSLSFTDFDTKFPGAPPILTSRTVFIQFSPLPSPSIIRLLSDDSQFKPGCKWNSTTLSLNKCLPGMSNIGLRGHYFYQPMSIMIGGAECRIVSAGVTSVTCYTPLYQFSSTEIYDLTVITLGGNATMTKAVTFTAEPVIGFVKPCSVSLQSFSIATAMNCFAGQTITLKVYNFIHFIVPDIQLQTYTYKLSCITPYYFDNFTLVCTLPSPPNSTWEYVSASLTAIWPDTTQSVTYSVRNIYDYHDAPRITVLNGCQGANDESQTTFLCMSGDVITLKGDRFLLYNWSVAIRDFQGNLLVPCSIIGTPNNTSLIFQLPGVESSQSLNFGNQYYLQLVEATRSQIRSNGLPITFVASTADVGNLASDTDSSTIIVLSVLFSFLGTLFAVIVCVLVYRSKISSRPRRQFVSYTSDSAQRIELIDSIGSSIPAVENGPLS